MRNRLLKRLAACALALMLSVSLALPAAAYESKCPRCPGTMIGTPVQPTCIDDGYIYLECPDCHATGTAHGAISELENRGNHYGHDYGSSGICSRCHDDARPPQTRPGLDIDPSFLTGEDGHTHDYKLMGNMYARQENEGHKQWVCQTCQAKMMEDVPPLDSDGMAQSGSTFRFLGGGASGSGSGSSTNPGTNPGTPTDPGSEGGGECQHSWGPKSLRKNATCTAEGEYVQVCRKCREEQTEIIPMKEHAYSSISYVAPTESTDGWRKYRCSSCGDVKTEVVPKLSSGSSGNQPGGQPGNPTGGQTGNETGSQPGQPGSQPGDQTGCKVHRWKTSTVQATCQAEGKVVQTCTACGTEQVLRTIPKAAHQWVQKTEAATTTAAGRTYRVCTVCGQEETLGTLAQKAHTGSGSTDLPKLGQQEITQLLQNAPVSMPSSDLYDAAPSVTAPHAPGKVKASVLQAALNRLNALRRIAGLPAVTLDADLCETAQYGAVLMGAAKKMSHFPDQPAGMSSAFYERGRIGTSSSNIASGYSLVGAVDAWMADSDTSNVDRCGHRFHQLSSELGKVGFGVYGGYTAENVSDHSVNSLNYDYIAWPASGNFPNNIFKGNYAWTVSLSPKTYSAASASDVSVTLSGGGKTWNLSGEYVPANAGKYLKVTSWRIIFRPDGLNAITASYFGTYTVTINGLRDKDGNPAPLSYEVNFFSPGGEPEPSVPTSESRSGKTPFTDVPKGSYYEDAVSWALEKGVTTGVTATQFSPTATCTRGQVVTFLWRAKGSPEPKTKSNPFKDVSSSSAFYKAILWAQENGITTGTTATTFNPGGTCTSGHVVTFLWRANGKPAASGTSGLAAAYPGKYYTDAVAWADSKGLLNGAGTAFNPANRSPRADIVTYLYRDLAG